MDYIDLFGVVDIDSSTRNLFVSIDLNLRFLQKGIDEFTSDISLAEFSFDPEYINCMYNSQNAINSLSGIGFKDIAEGFQRKQDKLVNLINLIRSFKILTRNVKDTVILSGEYNFIHLENLAHLTALISKKLGPEVALKKLEELFININLDDGLPDVLNSTIIFLSYFAFERIKRLRGKGKMLNLVLEDIVVVTEIIKMLELLDGQTKIKEILAEVLSITRQVRRELNSSTSSKYVNALNKQIRYLNDVSLRLPKSKISEFRAIFKNLSEYSRYDLEKILLEVQESEIDLHYKQELYNKLFQYITKKIDVLRYQRNSIKKHGRNPAKGIKKGVFTEDEIEKREKLMNLIEYYSELLILVKKKLVEN